MIFLYALFTIYKKCDRIKITKSRERKKCELVLTVAASFTMILLSALPVCPSSTSVKKYL